MLDLRRQSNLFSNANLRSAKVGIAGAGPISNFLCAYLSGLGIGEIVLVDNSVRRRASKKEFLSEICKKTSPKVRNMSKIIKKINPDMDVLYYFSLPNRLFFEHCSVVIDTTNDPKSKYRNFRHCENTGKLFLSCSSTETSSSICSYRFGSGKHAFLDDIIMKEYAGAEQGSFTSSLVAALAADEIRKHVCPIDGDKKMQKRISYSASSPDRFFLGKVPKKYFSVSSRPFSGCKGKKALVVGAGGIGTYVLLNLTMLGFNIFVYDGDAVEAHNLNRQIIHFGGVGNNKAEEAARKLKRIDFHASVNGFPEYLTAEKLKDMRRRGRRFDAVFSCVDSWKARKMLNNHCRLVQTPLFNGGVSTFGGVVDYFIPGKMHCLECSNDYRRRIEEETRPVSCGEVPANVVMPNAIIGSLMVAESMQIFSPGVVAAKHNRLLAYTSNSHSDKKFSPLRSEMFCRNPRYYRHDCRCHAYLKNG